MRKLPNTYVIIAILIVLCAVLTWFVPGGQYVTAGDGTLTYEEVPAVPQTWQVFSAIYNGFVKQAGIIIFILVVGGAFSLLTATGAVDAGIRRFIAVIGKKDKVILVALTLLFSLGGAVFGMSEEAIPFVGIVVPLVVSMGYDAIMGLLVVYVASNIGFSSAFLNPFTVGIAQGMADLPPFSGMGYRIFCWAFLTLLLCLFVVLYARKTKKEPQEGSALEAARLSARQAWILGVLLLTVIALVAGVTLWGWYMAEITGLFLAMGILCGIIARFPANRIADELIAGAKDILSAALVVGFASGIVIILQDGKIVDSILHGMQSSLDGTGEASSLAAMYGIQAVINFLIPSATAKAAITIPIMAPFSDLVGVSRQAMVLAFQFGDGFTNMITPTSGVLMAALAMARVPYEKWLKWVWKLVAVLLVLGLILLLSSLLFSDYRKEARQPVPRMAEGIIVPQDTLSLGLKTHNLAKFTTVHRSEGYVNNAVLTRFKGRYYCMWQESRMDEDTPDTRIMVATSADGESWDAPSVLVPPTEEYFASPGGWICRADSLTAFVNFIYAPDRSAGGKASFISTADGRSWTSPKPIFMADGTPVDGIFEQDPLTLPDGRTVGAVHFRPGTSLCPVYTDDPSCVRGWKKAAFPEGEGRPIEPSQYLARDGRLVMFFRDQKSSFRKLYSLSEDRGASWSAPRTTNIPDSRSKQCAGTLPDGRAYWVGNPTGSKSRRALALSLSEDGYLFSAACLLAGPHDLPPQRKEGRYKTLGYNYPKSFVAGETLWIALTVNKEDVCVVQVPCSVE